MQVAVFVGTRADLGPLESVIAELSIQQDIHLHIVTGVAFAAESLRSLLSVTLGISPEVTSLAPVMAASDQQSITEQGTMLVSGMQQFLTKHAIDALVVLGDRWELLFVVPQAYLHEVPVVHLHGGEVTEGALDERVRHAITKLADIHCVASAQAASRLRQLGEPTNRIKITGAPGLDRISTASPLSESELRERFGAAFSRPLALFTYHPPTSAGEVNAGINASEALRATLQVSGSVIVTEPGYDHGRDQIVEAIQQMAASDPRIVYVPSIGAQFPGVLAAVDLVVGNSSSGIIEAPGARVPSVDIGARQQGRERAASVIHAEEGYEGVLSAVGNAVERTFSDQDFHNPYWAGAAAAKIVAAIKGITGESRMKRFYDLTICDENGK